MDALLSDATEPESAPRNSPALHSVKPQLVVFTFFVKFLLIQHSVDGVN